MNTYNLKAGDQIKFINKVNYSITIEITRVEENSLYGHNNNRMSFGTINGYIKKYKAEIIRS